MGLTRAPRTGDTLGRAAPWPSIFRFCCWLPLVLLALHDGYTLLTHLLSVDPSLTLTSRHSLVPESVPLSIIILNRSLTYHWYPEGGLLATIQNIFPNQLQVQIKTS